MSLYLVFKHEPPFGLGVDVGTEVLVLYPASVCWIISPIVCMGLNSVMLNPISIRLSMFCNLEWESGWFKSESLSLMNSMCMICISLSVMSASPWAVHKIRLILPFSSSTQGSAYLGEGTCGRPSWMWATWLSCSTMSIFLIIFS